MGGCFGRPRDTRQGIGGNNTEIVLDLSWKLIGTVRFVKNPEVQWYLEKISTGYFYRVFSPEKKYYIIEEKIPLETGSIITLLPKRKKLLVTLKENARISKKNPTEFMVLKKYTGARYRITSTVLDSIWITNQWTLSFWIRRNRKTIHVDEEIPIMYKSGDLFRKDIFSPSVVLLKEYISQLFLRFTLLNYYETNVKDYNIDVLVPNGYKWNHIVWMQDKDVGAVFINGQVDLMPLILYRKIPLINNGELIFHGMYFEYKLINVYGRAFTPEYIQELHRRESLKVK